MPTTTITVPTESSTNASAVGSALLEKTSKVGTDVGNYLVNVNWAKPSWDLFIVLFFVITVFLYGLSLGRDRIIVILVSIYMAMAVITNAPYINKISADISTGQYFAFKVTAFLGIFLLLFFLLSRSALQHTFGSLAAGKWWQVFLFSTFHVGLLVSVTLSFLPSGAISNLAPLTQTLFASEAGRFFWIIAPIISMVVLKVEM